MLLFMCLSWNIIRRIHLWDVLNSMRKPNTHSNWVIGFLLMGNTLLFIVMVSKAMLYSSKKIHVFLYFPPDANFTNKNLDDFVDTLDEYKEEVEKNKRKELDAFFR